MFKFYFSHSYQNRKKRSQNSARVSLKKCPSSKKFSTPIKGLSLFAPVLYGPSSNSAESNSTFALHHRAIDKVYCHSSRGVDLIDGVRLPALQIPGLETYITFDHCCYFVRFFLYPRVLGLRFSALEALPCLYAITSFHTASCVKSFVATLCNPLLPVRYSSPLW